MGTVIASKILADAGKLLTDDPPVTWPDAERLIWLNAGQREIVKYKPSAYTTTAPQILVAGTRQTITGLQLIRVVRNMGTNGTTPGRAITLVDMDKFDTQRPNWHADAPSATVQHYLFDAKDPKAWYCYPPQPSADQGQVEVVQAALPPNVALVADPISIDDIYENELLDYILYRAYLKDTTSPGHLARAQGYWNAFARAMGLDVQTDKAFSPNTTAAPYESDARAQRIGAK